VTLTGGRNRLLEGGNCSCFTESLASSTRFVDGLGYFLEILTTLREKLALLSKNPVDMVAVCQIQ
jgi:hypothetical protein